tara:strand:+ start:13780 stop:13932 length:153 start_codon:yes stop_codon:yes gene_type:complete
MMKRQKQSSKAEYLKMYDNSMRPAAPLTNALFYYAGVAIVVGLLVVTVIV